MVVRSIKAVVYHGVSTEFLKTPIGEVFIGRKNPDGTPWKPGTGDRVCSNHFISGKNLTTL